MEELIFFAVIIFFSIIDSVARSRKKKQQQGGAPEATVPKRKERQRAVPRYDTEATHVPQGTYESQRTYESQPTYDADPSHDESWLEEAKSDAEGSEGMIPTDIWEEIAGLARSKVPAPTRPAPAPVKVESIPARPVETHRVHRAHAGYGTDPSSRARSEQDGMDPLAVRSSADVLAIRHQLRAGRHALRQAFVFREVLGPPVSLRREGSEE
ncbi:MAG: hypothetical protein OEO79_00240 [Gemmatimonadota bacterium]|nr:hypothetical protein [Gemmatimonadota bacterium]MDH3422740.1 hypothetical protein [Gemmatimonadota bacterium]